MLCVFSTVVGFNNMEDIINAMHNKEIAGALLDMYAAATKKDSFDGGDIQLNRLIEYPTGYGFVLSGDMAKAAPLFREALATHKNKISEIVEGNTESIQLVSVTTYFQFIFSYRLFLISFCYYTGPVRDDWTCTPGAGCIKLLISFFITIL